MRYADEFDAFLESCVNLNQHRIDRLQQRVDSIHSFLEDSSLGEAVEDLIPAGSWAHRTIIRLIATNDTFDADVLLLLTEQPDWQAEDYLSEVHAIIRGNGVYRDLVGRDPKTRCVRVNYADEFHIDVVPYVERHGRHYITNRLTGQFELSDPEAFTAWVDERQRITNGHFIEIVRLLKYLRDFKNTFSCKSIILKTLLGEQVNAIDELAEPGCYEDLPTALRTIITKLVANLPETMPAVLDPGGTGDNFTDRYQDDWHYPNFRSRMIAYADKIDAAYEEEDAAASLRLWQEIFGDDLKPAASVTKAASAPRASQPWSNEQFIDRPPFNFRYAAPNPHRVTVKARVTGFSKGNVQLRKGFRQFSLAHHGNRVPKNRSITFSATTDVVGAYGVYWKVRNGGVEAEATGQLRGEIHRDDGRHQRVETTLYRGYHYVECYVVKDGQVIALDRQSVIVT